MRSRLEFFSASLFPARCRACLAGFCLLIALACFWSGADLYLTGPAAADSSSASVQIPEPENIRLKKQLLQATVDSAAFSLAGILADLPDPAARRGVLAAALDALTFDLGAPVYFTAWENTRLVHSPLTPDAANLDFSDALDGLGRPFIRILSAAPAADGGFFPLRLRRHVFDRGAARRDTAFGPAAQTAGSVSPASVNALFFSAAPLPREEEEARIAYSRLIPGSGWRICAFLPAPEDFPARPVSAVERAGSVWEAPKKRPDRLPDDLRLGLFISGFSFLGLAGVLLLPHKAGSSHSDQNKTAALPPKKAPGKTGRSAGDILVED
ncbi:MAG: hypothetical protein LBP61_05000 [Desulfovibrio sp.]|jgi:hypothetical protein|nr:hypothetical protein [Desulfovibrio sp.]